MTTQGEDFTAFDPVKAAIWIGLLTAFAKIIHLVAKWVAKYFVVPLFGETARQVLAEDLRTFHAAAEVSRETAGTLQLTILELERAIDNLTRLTSDIAALSEEVGDHRAQLMVIASHLDHELPPLPERRQRKAGPTDG